MTIYKAEVVNYPIWAHSVYFSSPEKRDAFAAGLRDASREIYVHTTFGPQRVAAWEVDELRYHDQYDLTADEYKRLADI